MLVPDPGVRADACKGEDAKQQRIEDRFRAMESGESEAGRGTGVSQATREVVGQPHDRADGATAVHAADVVQDVGGLQTHPERRKVTVQHAYLHTGCRYQLDACRYTGRASTIDPARGAQSSRAEFQS